MLFNRSIWDESPLEAWEAYQDITGEARDRLALNDPARRMARDRAFDAYRSQGLIDQQLLNDVAFRAVGGTPSASDPWTPSQNLSLRALPPGAVRQSGAVTTVAEAPSVLQRVRAAAQALAPGAGDIWNEAPLQARGWSPISTAAQESILARGQGGAYAREIASLRNRGIVDPQLLSDLAARSVMGSPSGSDLWGARPNLPLPALPPAGGTSAVVNSPLGNASKLEASIASPVPPAMRQASGGPVAAAGIADPWGPATVPPSTSMAGDAIASARGARQRAAGPAPDVLDLGGLGSTPAAVVDRGPELNVSDGGPGTSTAKGTARLQEATARRSGGVRQWLANSFSPAFGAPDLGAGRAMGDGLERLANARALQGKPIAGALMRGAGAARFLAPAAALAAPLVPVAMGAAEGYSDAGTGGALIQGGTAAAGSLLGGAAAGALAGSVVPGFGTVVGAGLGALFGSMAGKGLTGVAQGLVEKSQMGDTGPLGGIGRALDSVIDTPFEKEQKAVLQQMNSPAMRALQQQEELRRMKAANDRREQLVMQAMMQGYV